MTAIQELADLSLGRRFVSSQSAFYFCLKIALFYTLISLVVGWSLGGPVDLGGRPLFTDGGLVSLPRIGRGLVLLGLFCMVSVLFWVVYDRVVAIDGEVRDFVVTHFKKGKTALSRNAAWFFGAVTAVIVLTSTSTAASMIAGPGAFAIIVVGAYLVTSWAGISENAVAVPIGAGVFVATIAFTVVSFFTSGAWDIVNASTPETGLQSVGGWGVIVILGAVPVINAACDAVSLGVSRGLLRHLFPANGTLPRLAAIAGHALLDAILAVVSVVLLIVLLVAATETVDSVFGAPVLPWRHYAKAALDSPLGAGIAVTVMLLSPLAWTALHLTVMFAAMAAGLLPVPGGRQDRAGPPDDRRPSGAARLAVAGAVSMAGCVGLASAVAVGALVVWAAGLAGLPVGTMLMEVADWTAGAIPPSWKMP